MINDCLGWMAKKKKKNVSPSCDVFLPTVKISWSANTVEAAKLIQTQCFRLTPQLCSAVPVWGGRLWVQLWILSICSGCCWEHVSLQSLGNTNTRRSRSCVQNAAHSTAVDCGNKPPPPKSTDKHPSKPNVPTLDAITYIKVNIQHKPCRVVRWLCNRQSLTLCVWRWSLTVRKVWPDSALLCICIFFSSFLFLYTSKYKGPTLNQFLTLFSALWPQSSHPWIILPIAVWPYICICISTDR